MIFFFQNIIERLVSTFNILREVSKFYQKNSFYFDGSNEWFEGGDWRKGALGEGGEEEREKGVVGLRVELGLEREAE